MEIQSFWTNLLYIYRTYALTGRDDLALVGSDRAHLADPVGVSPVVAPDLVGGITGGGCGRKCFKK